MRDRRQRHVGQIPHLPDQNMTTSTTGTHRYSTGINTIGTPVPTPVGGSTGWKTTKTANRYNSPNERTTMTKNQSCASCSGLFHRTQILKRRTYQICKPCDTKIKALGHDVPWFPQTFLPRDFTGVPHVSDITSQLFEAELTPAQLHDYLENIWWDYAMRRDQPSDPMTIKMQLSVPCPTCDSTDHNPHPEPR